MSDSRVAKAEISDAELLAALEEAEEEYGSMAEALRNAVKTAYAGDDDDVDGERLNDENDLPVKAREGYHKLVEWAEVGGRLELDTATSILANHLNIPKKGVEGRIIKPLVGANVLWKDWSYENVWVVVGTLDGEPLGTETAPDPSETEPTEAEIATDGGGVRERLDELAAAGAEVADGE
ncbi:hypothetical protein [Halorubrum lipolyticum]|uniref:Uncharacterized protein n=1 Tax=Halorubrum lipolyticum DSM 21995 TaxID=1227482 RepID=M0P4C6_9EURY|nr:hypothetical protein [Halorubrum lipolyticum]EMA64653.1 hypothetical protein C469_00315 [Halorubrum lipolyticum DSM 21995]